jgi:hypothetical protein
MGSRLRTWETIVALSNKPLQRMNACAVRSEVGSCRDAAGCARGSSRPWYARATVRRSPLNGRSLGRRARGMEKDDRLRAAVAGLRGRFGDAIDLVDYWEADLRAIGISRRGERTRLVYLSLASEQEGRFDVALELPPRSSSGLPFENGGWHHGLVLSEVADVVAVHLGLA